MFSGASYSQYSESSVDKMLAEVGTSIDKIEIMYVGNIKLLYTDGTSAYSYTKFISPDGSKTYKYVISEQGIGVKTYRDGTLESYDVYNFEYIKNVKIEKNKISIHLAN